MVMKIAVGAMISTTGCHHCRVTNSSGRPTAVRHASSAPLGPRSPSAHSRSGTELRLTFLNPAASVTTTAPHENSTIVSNCESDRCWYSEKIPTVPSAIVSAESSSKARYARKQREPNLLYSHPAAETSMDLDCGGPPRVKRAA